jgi:membrane fusion protein, multidrug efflux system
LRAIDVGNVVTGGNAGGTVLLTIEKFDPIYTDFSIAENDMAQVRRYLGGPNVKVQTDSPDDNSRPLLGDLYFIDNAVQPGSGTVKARGITPNPDRILWPGEFVRVRLILDKLTGAKLVPSQTVQISQQGPFVFVVKPDNTVEQRPVKPGQRQEGDMMVIEDGVKPDETVVVTGQLALAPGVKVAPQPMNAPASPANASPSDSLGSK